MKGFSAGALTKRLYRGFGNTVGARQRVRAGMPRPYVDRARHIVLTVREFDLVRPGDRLLELGTGWLHWESTILRLFYDVEVTMFDVWDNRQFAPFQRYLRDFGRVVEAEIPMDEAERRRVRGLLAALDAARDFDEAYRILGHRYVVDAKGDLSGLPAESYSLVMSATVLEHIPRDVVRRSIAQTFRLLRPGGHSAHGIDLGDHLAYYDPAIDCLKNYLRYSDRTWRWVFDNDIQYINRIQPAEWLSIFRDAGFELRSEYRNTIDLTGVPIAEPFRGLAPEDLACSTLFVLHRKPVGAVAGASPGGEAGPAGAPPA